MLRPSFVLLLPLLLAACGGLSDEERQAAMGGALVPDAGAADRSAALSADADERRRDMAAAAETARLEKAKADEARRQEMLRLAAEQRARAEFPDGIDQLVARGDDGPILVGPDDRDDERWAARDERRARAMRDRAERQDHRAEREARARDRREQRMRERGYFEERYAEQRPLSRREAEAQLRDMRRRDRDDRRFADAPFDDDDAMDDGYRR